MKYLHAVLSYSENFDDTGGTQLAEIVLGVEDDKQSSALHEGLEYLGLKVPRGSVLQYAFKEIANEPTGYPQWTNGTAKLWVITKKPKP